ncbi:MAG: phytanoyl-CoA dioxygenase family protein [bacterium]|nr:phytanoyl-CoA dioxygenase family protein [bacterium]
MYTSESVIVQDARPFDAEQTESIVSQFNRDGYCFLKGVLTQKEVDTLRELMERKYQDPRMHEEAGDHIRGTSMMRMYEYDVNFRDLICREPIVSLAEAILGEDCHMMSQNSLRYEPGQGGGWHVDDRLHFPLPEGVDRHDARIPLPCFVLNVLIPLSRADALEYGVTEVVPGSQFSGRRPNRKENPTFEGQGPVSLIAEVGDVYMFHNQVWHRGSPNNSDQVRYVGSVVYSQRIIAQRLYPFIDYRMPEYVWEGTDKRMQRFLGRHDKGAYG